MQVAIDEPGDCIINTAEQTVAHALGICGVDHNKALLKAHWDVH